MKNMIHGPCGAINRNFKAKVIGRIYNIHPRVGECYYLRLLLFHVRDPVSFNDFKTHDGITYHSYREACRARRLLEEGQYLRSALQDTVPSKINS